MKKQLLLVSDIDGTLLDSKGQLSDKNIQAIHDFMDQGHYFALSTGRTRLSAKPILDVLKPNAPCIFMNGALLQEANGTILDSKALQTTYLIDFLTQLIQKIPTCVVEIFTEDDILIISNPQNKDPFIEENHIPVTYLSIEEALKYHWIKILICDQNIQTVSQFYKTFELDQHFNSFYSSNTFFEIVPLGINKGTTLRQLANQLHCPCLAIGDFDNDLEMIQEADYSATVANASEHLKYRADFISKDNDHDALADFIQHLEEEQICQIL